MAITLVQSVRASGNSGTSASATLASTAAGNLLVALVDGEQNPGNPTITAPANWTQANTTTTQNIFIALNAAHFYYTNNPGAITTVSFTFSAAVSAWHIELLEFSGVATATPLDVSALRSQQATLTPSSGSVTTTVAGDLAVGWMIEDDVNGAYTLTQPSGWTALPRNQDAGVWASQYSAWQVQSAAGAIQYNPTLTSTATDSIVGILTFKAAGGGGSIVSGSGSEIANSVLAESAATLVASGDTVQANAAVVSPAATLIVTAGNDVLASNSALSVAATIITTANAQVANSALVEVAQIVEPAATVPVVATGVLSVTGGLAGQGGGSLVANALLAESAARLITSGNTQIANSLLAEAVAQLLTRSLIMAASSALAVSGGVIGQNSGSALHGTTIVRPSGEVGLSVVRTAENGVTLVRLGETANTVIRASESAVSAVHASLVGTTTIRGG